MTARRGQPGDSPTWVVLVLVLVVTWGLLAIPATRLPPGPARDLVSIVPDSARAARVWPAGLVAAWAGEPAVLRVPSRPRGRRG